jgi:soluble lytic murein transglycosylase-like protein
MQPFAFCMRCRGMRVGWNGRYILHCLSCKEWFSKSTKLLIFTVLLSVLVLGFPTPSAYVFSGQSPAQEIQEAGFDLPLLAAIDPAVTSMKTLLKRYHVDEAHCDRIASAIVKSSRKYDIDPKLVASIMIVESRANPFAISHLDSIGIMQIHLPTWGTTAEEEGINLFKIEDNVDFGVRILRDYVRRFGLWEAVKRYNGLTADNPDSAQAAEDYLAKVKNIYGTEKSALSSEFLNN